ncbi:MAG: hypothetical protein J6N52_11115 [Clostridia bacterium]|nr:hypothetical protein [Clostridia bacterium]
MKNLSRKMTALILSAMMLMSLAPSMGFAAEAENTVLASGLSEGTHNVSIRTTDTTAFVKSELPSASTGMLVYTNVSNPDFIGQTEKQTYNAYNWVVVTGTQDEINAGKLKAPIYLSYEMQSLVDPDSNGVIDYDVKEAYLLTTGSNNNMPVNIYDIPSNDISISTIGVTGEDGTTTYTPPVTGNTAVSGNNNEGAALFNTLNEAGKFGDLSTGKMSKAFDITDYTNSILSENRTSFSIMIYSTWASSTNFMGSGDADTKPRIYLSLIEKPELEIVSAGTQDYVTDDAVFAVKAYDETGIAQVEFYLNDELKATVTDGTDGVYTWKASDLEPGTYTLKAAAVAVSGAAQTVTKTVDIRGLGQIIRFTDRIKVNNTDSVIEKPTSTTSGILLDTRNGQKNIEAYYNFDISSLKNKTDEIEKVYLLTQGKNGGRAAMVYNCENYDLSAITQYADVANIKAEDTKTAYFNLANPYIDRDYPINAVDGSLYPKAVAYGTDNLMRCDVTEYIKNSIAAGNTALTLKFTAGAETLFENFCPLYLYAEYKDDTPLAADNGGSLKINVRPSKYITPAADTSITVLIAQYDSKGTFAGAQIETVAATDKYTSYDIPLTDAKYKVFVWDSISTMKPLLDIPATNIAEGE